MCDEQSLRSACAYGQSDQSLCMSLEYSMTVKLLTEHHLEFLSLKGGCTDSSESTHVKCHIVGNHMSRLIYHLQKQQEHRTKQKERQKALEASVKQKEKALVKEGKTPYFLKKGKVKPVLSGHSKKTKNWFSRPIIA